MLFILFRNEAVVTEELAVSCSKRCWEAVGLPENGSLGCGLAPDVGREDGVGPLAGAFLSEEADACYKHKKGGGPAHAALPGTLPILPPRNPLVLGEEGQLVPHAVVFV